MLEASYGLAGQCTFQSCSTRGNLYSKLLSIPHFLVASSRPSRCRIVRPCAARMPTHDRRDPGEMASPGRQAEKQRVSRWCAPSQKTTLAGIRMVHITPARPMARRDRPSSLAKLPGVMTWPPTHWRDKEQWMPPTSYTTVDRYFADRVTPSSIMGRHAALDLLPTVDRYGLHACMQPSRRRRSNDCKTQTFGLGLIDQVVMAGIRTSSSINQHPL
ncbi:hypothetical protein CGRA01v4_10210 [Colletotrichum graminicola]|nr:hypothetical protein CGRA01v4_10210 [Colletotrichum graminicola]